MYEKIDMAYSYMTSSHIPSTLFFIIVCIERIYSGCTFHRNPRNFH